ncbi:MAG: hypothetical protein EBV03_02910 [Proteobacteria bacterium]|nr:hypothetical protein [Pseudomonadota bacterium]
MDVMGNETNLADAKDKVQQVYTERTAWHERLYDSTLGKLPNALSSVTSWAADNLSSFISKDTTKAAVPILAAGGAGLASYFLGDAFAGNSTLGTVLTLGTAGILSYGAFKAFQVNDTISTGTVLKVDGPPAREVVKSTSVEPPKKTVEGNIVAAPREKLPVIDRQLTTPVGIKWPEIIAVETDDLAKGGKLTVQTAKVKNVYQNWEEGVRKIHEGVRDYNTYTRDVLVHHLGTFGVSADDIKIWGAIPEAPTPPKLLHGSDNLTPILDRVGQKLAKDKKFPGLTAETWAEQTVSTKLNHLREWIHKIRTENKGDFWSDNMSLMYAMTGLSGANGHMSPYSEIADQTRDVALGFPRKNPRTRIDLEPAINLYDHIGQARGVETMLAKATLSELDAYDAKYHAPNRAALEDFAKKDGRLDAFNAAMTNMQQKFNTLASSINQHRVAVLKMQETGLPSNAAEGFVTIKDARTHVFGQNEKAVTRTIAFKKEGDKYKITGWIDGDASAVNWVRPTPGTDVFFDPKDAANIRKTLDSIMPEPKQVSLKLPTPANDQFEVKEGKLGGLLPTAFVVATPRPVPQLAA